MQVGWSEWCYRVKANKKQKSQKNYVCAKEGSGGWTFFISCSRCIMVNIKLKCFLSMQQFAGSLARISATYRVLFE